MSRRSLPLLLKGTQAIATTFLENSKNVLPGIKLYSLFRSIEKTNFVSQRQKSLVQLNSIQEMLVTQCDRLS
jgi:hypothetical protein